VGVDADAEDLSARTFEKAWRARARYRHDLSGFSTWLFTIAHNVAMDFLRLRRPHGLACSRGFFLYVNRARTPPNLVFRFLMKNGWPRSAEAALIPLSQSDLQAAMAEMRGP